MSRRHEWLFGCLAFCFPCWISPAGGRMPCWRKNMFCCFPYSRCGPSMFRFLTSRLLIFLSFFFNSMESSRFCEVYCQGCISLLRLLCSCDIYFPPISHLSFFLRTRHLIFSFFICFHFYLPTLSGIYFFSAVLTTIFDCVLFYTFFQFPFIT